MLEIKSLSSNDIYSLLMSLEDEKEADATVNEKYEFTNESKVVNDHLVHRIIAKKDFGTIKCGEKGGWIESEKNLSKNGNCWVTKNAVVYEDARILDNALVDDSAKVFGNAIVHDSAIVFGEAQVYGKSLVGGLARITQSAKIFGEADVSGGAFIYGECVIRGNAMVSGDNVVCDNVSLMYGRFVGNEYIFGSAPAYLNRFTPTFCFDDLCCTWLDGCRMVSIRVLPNNYYCYTNSDCAKYWCKVNHKHPQRIVPVLDAIQVQALCIKQNEISSDLNLCYDAFLSLYTNDSYKTLKSLIYERFSKKVYVEEWIKDPHVTLAYCKDVSTSIHNEIIKGIIDVHSKKHIENTFSFDRIEVVGKNRLALVCSNPDLEIMNNCKNSLRKQKCKIEYDATPMVHLTILKLSQRVNMNLLTKILDDLNEKLSQNPIILHLWESNLVSYSNKAKKVVLLKLR